MKRSIILTTTCLIVIGVLSPIYKRVRDLFEGAPDGAFSLSTPPRPLGILPTSSVFDAILRTVLPTKQIPTAYTADGGIPLKRVFGSYTAGSGVGYSSGYSTLGVLFSTSKTPTNVYPVVDLRGHYLNNNSWAANAGVGARFILPSTCTVVGVNVFYDFRQNNSAIHNQIGVGVELIGKWINLSLNGYFPVGRNNQTTKFVFDDYIGPYRVVCTLNDFAYTSGNAEMGAYLFQTPGLSLYAGVGPYYLRGQFGNNAFGAAGRLEAQLSEYISIAFIASHDKIFGTHYQGQFTLSLPLYRFSSQSGSSSPSSTCSLTNRQLYQAPQRSEIIPTSVQACYYANF